MDVPLKSQPKVSTVNLLDDEFDVKSSDKNVFSDSVIKAFRTRENLDEYTNQLDLNDVRNYKLARTYSETEKNNFDFETGHRLYDDGKIRPQLSRTNSQAPDKSSNERDKIYSKSQNDYLDDHTSEYLIGLEDEYIPGLDFGDLVYKWNSTPQENNDSIMYEIRDENATLSTSSIKSLASASRDASYLDLNQLHAKVAPQPINSKYSIENKYSFSKLHDFMKLRTPRSNILGENNSTANNNSIPSTGNSIDELSNQKKRKLKSNIVNPETGDINYELILNSLPQNFNDLPYSQRKKLVKSFSESIDYSQFSLFAKNFYSDKFVSTTPRSGSVAGSFVRRPRRNSSNTVAERLLAMSSSNDLKNLANEKPKINVDEKGAIVLGYELGKIIGFGAWGTIRECTNKNGEVRAIKIVKSYSKDYEPSSPSKASFNPKVLDVFKKEIKIWKTLDHENILPLLNYVETENTIFCITKKIFGGTLFELVSSWGIYNAALLNSHGPIDFSFEKHRQRLIHVAKYAKQIVNALMYLHENMGIVHGDLKLENVLIDDNDKENFKMILCDFGMSRVYLSRLSRKASRNFPNEADLMMRSKSSTTDLRRPYTGDSSVIRHLFFSDDSKIGISHIEKPHGPSPQSFDLTPRQSKDSLVDYFSIANKSPISSGIDSDLPHSHIGSLPYAAPELLQPSPPPLGPSADIWAFGVLLYTMVVGRLPFQHQFEPRLRMMITAGKYNKSDLMKACLVDWIGLDLPKTDENLSEALSTPKAWDTSRKVNMLRQQWQNSDTSEFKWLCEMICGCLELNITKRWDINMIYDTFSRLRNL